MDERDMFEQAFKNGYEKGKPKWIPVTERLPDVGCEWGEQGNQLAQIYGH